MPKRSSTYQAEQDDPNDETHLLDPLIEALLGHLPASGDPFPNRKLWMQVLELVLQLVYPEGESEGGEQT